MKIRRLNHHRQERQNIRQQQWKARLILYVHSTNRLGVSGSFLEGCRLRGEFRISFSFDISFYFSGAGGAESRKLGVWMKGSSSPLNPRGPFTSPLMAFNWRLALLCRGFSCRVAVFQRVPGLCVPLRLLHWMVSVWTGCFGLSTNRVRKEKIICALIGWIFP